MVIDVIHDWIGLIIQFGTLITMLWAAGKFLGRPNQTQNERITLLERRADTIYKRLEKDEAHFKQIDKGNAVLFSSLLAIMDALISGDNKEELTKQRTKLYNYISGLNDGG